MPLLHVIILAIVQGITEFLPISSSAHLALAPWLLGWRDQGLVFDIALHLGTLLAVLLYFGRAWIQILAQGFGLSFGNDPQLKRNRRILWYLTAATIPVAVLGALFEHTVETAFRNPMVIGTMLIVVGLVMLLAERVSGRRKGLAEITFTDSLIIGAAQTIALIPGTSRSGITITAALFRHVDRSSAAAFSFLLSTPAIGGAAAKAAYDLIKQGGIPADMRLQFGLGVVLSGLTGCAVIALFLRFLRRHSLHFFIYYRIIFGIIVIALAILVREKAG